MTVDFDISNVVYRILTAPIDLLKFAKTNYNCVLHSNTQWRCTYYGVGFTMNMFSNQDCGKIILFTTKDIADIIPHILTTLKCRESDITIEMKNMVVKFKLGRQLDLHEVFRLNTNMKEDDLRYVAQELNISTCVQSNVFEPDKFPAVIVTPFLDSNISIEIFENGNVNAAGIKSSKDTSRISCYLERMMTKLPALF